MAGSRRSPRPRGWPPARCCRGRRAGSLAASTRRGSPASANLIPFDMGGTSTDIASSSTARPALVIGPRVGGHRIALRQPRHRQHRRRRRLDRPGRCRRHPACRAGKRRRDAGPGLLRPWRHRGDRHRRQPRARLSRPGELPRRRRLLDRAAAEAAVDRIAAALGIDRLAAAHGIHRIVNTKMAEGVRLVSVRRGVDPRRFALFAFGGAAGLHATEIARQLELGGSSCRASPRCCRPGACWRPICASRSRGAISATRGRSTAARSSACSTRWRPRGWRGCAPPFAGPARATRSVDMRYGEQVFEITVPLDDVDWAWPTRCRRSSTAFTAATRSSTPIPRPTRKPCWSTPASPFPASSRNCRRSLICPRRRRPAPRRAADLSRRLGHGAGLRFRRAGAGAGDHRTGDDQIGDDDGAAAPRRCGPVHRAGLARHHCVGAAGRRVRSIARKGLATFGSTVVKISSVVVIRLTSAGGEKAQLSRERKGARGADPPSTRRWRRR